VSIGCGENLLYANKQPLYGTSQVTGWTVRILALSTSAVFCRPSGASDPQRAAGVIGLELRVMTFNIRYGTADDGQNAWEQRRDMVFALLREARADVLGLQEALRFQIDEIRDALADYGEVGVARDDGDRAGEYAVILYRRERFDVDESGTFWFSDTPETPGSKHWGNYRPRICTWARLIERAGRRAFYIYNVHLDGLSQPARERSVQLLVERIERRAHPDPVVVTGDFNAGEENPAVQYLLRGPDAAQSRPVTGLADWIDTFRALYPTEREVGTFHAFFGMTTGQKIDYILVQRGAEVLDARIIRDHRERRYPSDHFPVAATVRFAAPQPAAR
jgi:endonuclease/exonuclease/phosphatase family metal-dependent hydrolase